MSITRALRRIATSSWAGTGASVLRNCQFIASTRFASTRTKPESESITARRIGAFGVGEGRLDSVFVAGAQFDGIEAGGLQSLDHSLQIHIVEDVIGDGA